MPWIQSGSRIDHLCSKICSPNPLVYFHETAILFVPSLRREEGIRAADATFIMKQAIKDACKEKGILATFMTRPFSKKEIAVSQTTVKLAVTQTNYSWGAYNIHLIKGGSWEDKEKCSTPTH